VVLKLNTYHVLPLINFIKYQVLVLLCSDFRSINCIVNILSEYAIITTKFHSPSFLLLLPLLY
jgi:hypothetical protein